MTAKDRFDSHDRCGEEEIILSSLAFHKRQVFAIVATGFCNRIDGPCFSIELVVSTQISLFYLSIYHHSALFHIDMKGPSIDMKGPSIDMIWNAKLDKIISSSPQRS